MKIYSFIKEIYYRKEYMDERNSNFIVTKIEGEGPEMEPIFYYQKIFYFHYFYF